MNYSITGNEFYLHNTLSKAPICLVLFSTPSVEQSLAILHSWFSSRSSIKVSLSSDNNSWDVVWTNDLFFLFLPVGIIFTFI